MPKAERGKREALAWLLSMARVSSIVPRLRIGAAPFPILAYHRVFDIGVEDDFPFDPELVSASVAEFTWQMETLARRFRPLHLSAALRLLEEGKRLPKRSVAVTFDDGHADNFTHAFPVLQALRMPATIFLSSSYMGRQETFWFDALAFRLYRTARTELALETLGLQLELGDVAQRRRAAATVLAAMKEVPNAHRLAALRELADKSGVPGPLGEARSMPLSWGQVRQMRDGGVEFGSHAMSHPILSQLDDAELHAELAGSKAEIEREVGRPVETLAYPVGGENAYDARVVSVARECGYRFGLTYVRGMNSWPPEDSFRVRRLHVERYTSRARFEAMLAFPAIFG
jgi:peptidoglycan/xylan/chitin deacetylase (PgdA/CDA1 family)